jgi:pyridoxamine 5'-phosphate oxidase
LSDISDIRRRYTRGGLRAKDLPDEPFALFETWMEQARDAQLSDPTAMTVATVDAQGQPFQRIVLLKHFDSSGFVFYTNLGSRKAQHIAANAKVSLHFPWHPLDRQVHIIGSAERLSQVEVLKYFVSRPKESQISAWVSRQSSRISTRQLLEAKFFEFKQKFADGEIPVPSFWGGYRVPADSIEFWQGGDHRLHDRFLFSRAESGWSIERLAP